MSHIIQEQNAREFLKHYACHAIGDNKWSRVERFDKCGSVMLTSSVAGFDVWLEIANEWAGGGNIFIEVVEGNCSLEYSVDGAIATLDSMDKSINETIKGLHKRIDRLEKHKRSLLINQVINT